MWTSKKIEKMNIKYKVGVQKKNVYRFNLYKKIKNLINQKLYYNFKFSFNLFNLYIYIYSKQ